MLIACLRDPGGGGDPGGHARALGSAPAPRGWPGCDHGEEQGAVRLRRGRCRDAEPGAGGAAPAGVSLTAGGAGAGADRELCRDAAPGGVAPGAGGADRPGPAGRAGQAHGGGLGAGGDLARQRCAGRGDRPATGGGAYHRRAAAGPAGRTAPGQPRRRRPIRCSPGPFRSPRRSRKPRRCQCQCPFPCRGRRWAQSRHRSASRRRRRVAALGLSRLAPCWRPGRGSSRARWPRGMRVRCCCTPSAPEPVPGTSWPLPGLIRTAGGSLMWRCCRPPVPGSRSAPPRSSSSST